MSDLPADLVEEIIFRVPATDLKRLRSTCKQWDALFRNRGFTEKHFSKATKQSLVLVWKDYRVCSMSVNLNVVSPSLEFKGELGLKDSEGVNIDSVFHCDGMLLCTTIDKRLVIWNPCLGETRWIKTDIKGHSKVSLGYQNNKSCRSYKILRCWDSFEPPININYVVGIELYEFDSDSWRALDSVSCHYLVKPDIGVSMKGNTYWLSPHSLGTFLASFDFTTERFKRLNLPPIQDLDWTDLTVVRDEQLSLLIEKNHTTKVEIWMAKNIDTEATFSWNKSFIVDRKNLDNCSFPVCNSYQVDEEKRVVVCCYGYMVGIIGEDDACYTKLKFDQSRTWSRIFNYVPSLVQIQ